MLDRPMTALWCNSEGEPQFSVLFYGRFMSKAEHKEVKITSGKRTGEYIKVYFDELVEVA